MPASAFAIRVLLVPRRLVQAAAVSARILESRVAAVHPRLRGEVPFQGSLSDVGSGIGPKPPGYFVRPASFLDAYPACTLNSPRFGALARLDSVVREEPVQTDSRIP